MNKRQLTLMGVVAVVLLVGIAATPDPQFIGKKDHGLYGPMHRAGCKNLQLAAVMDANHLKTIEKLSRLRVGYKVNIPDGCSQAPSADIAKRSMMYLAAENAYTAQRHAASAAVTQSQQQQVQVIPQVKALGMMPKVAANPSQREASVLTTKSSPQSVRIVPSFWPGAGLSVGLVLLGAFALAMIQIFAPVVSFGKFPERVSVIKMHGLEYQRSDSVRCVGPNGCGARLPVNQIDGHHTKPIHVGLRKKVMPTQEVGDGVILSPA